MLLATVILATATFWLLTCISVLYLPLPKYKHNQNLGLVIELGLYCSVCDIKRSWPVFHLEIVQGDEL